MMLNPFVWFASHPPNRRSEHDSGPMASESIFGHCILVGRTRARDESQHADLAVTSQTKKIATTGNVNFTNKSLYRTIEAWPAATIEGRLLVDAANLIGQSTSDLFITTTFETSIHMLHTNFTSSCAS
jgi:Tfp pilus assembly ATPase PilU